MLFRLLAFALCAVSCTSNSNHFAAKTADSNELLALRSTFGEAPPVTDEAVTEVLRAFNIQLPTNVDGPQLRVELEDRGRTAWLPGSDRIRVSVGPKAFKSWGLLASTLAHELEVHAKQDIEFISLLNSIGLPGTAWAERRAYEHELANAERFGLSDAEVATIRATMDYYYPPQN
jgi:hypothetical protein